MKIQVKGKSRFDIPFLRLMLNILFYPCFLLMFRNLPVELHITAGGSFFFALSLYLFPRLNHLMNKTLPFPLFFDLAFVSAVLYYAGPLVHSLAILYLFPVTTAAFQNKAGLSLLSVALAGGLYLAISLLRNLNLGFTLIQIILFFIITFYVWFLSRQFHQTYFRQANQDTLTRINNRRYLNYTMEQLIESQTPYALILMDLDNFKTLNDTQGHHHGDYVLKIIASIIKECVRSYDIVARYGGDEFTIILPHTSKSESRVIAERIRNSVLVNPKLMPYSFISISQGIASYPDDAVTLEEILQKADEALYVAKSRGKNCIHIYGKE